jgi:hypothetical protein
MYIPEQPQSAQHQVEGAIAAISEATTELEAETIAAAAKGHISALRYNQLIQHEVFKALDEAIDKALSDWHWKHDKL